MAKESEPSLLSSANDVFLILLYHKHDDNAKDAIGNQQNIARLNNYKETTYEYMLDEAGYYVKNDVGDFIIQVITERGYDDTLMDK